MRIERYFLTAAVMGSLAFITLDAHHANAQQATSAQTDPYARYSTPGQCVLAGQRLNVLYWRDKRQDTVSYGPATDSVPASVIEEVRACMSRFTLDGVREHELIDFARAQLVLNQDDQAEAAFAKLLASPSQQEPIQRGWTLLKIMEFLQGAKPARLDAATKYLAQLDALGDTVATWRMMGHYGASSYAMSVDDRTAAEAEARASLAASAKMSKGDRQDFVVTLVEAYDALAEPVAIVENNKTQASAIFDTARADLLPLMPEGSREHRSLANRLEATETPYTLFGNKAVPIMGDQWFAATPGQDAAGIGNNYPVPGEVNVLVFVNANCGGRCFPTYATLRRLQEKFADRGVNFIATQAISGWFRNKLTDSQEEANLVSGYFQDFLELPVNLAVEFRVMEKRARDGRMMRPPTENLRNYNKRRNIVIIRKDGTIGASASRFSPSREIVWNALLERALTE